MWMRHLLAACVAAAALCAGSGARAQDHSELELEFERESGPSPRDVLALSGFALFGFAYTNAVWVGIFSGRHADRRLFIPVAGPWLDLAERDCSGCSAEWLARTLLVADGAAQGVGVGLMIASIFAPSRPADIRVGSSRVHIAPLVGRGAVGIAGSGTL